MEAWQEYLESMKKSGIGESKSGTGKSTNTSGECKLGKSPTSDPSQICEICHGSGWEYFIGEDGYEYARECKCGIRQKQIHESRLKFASIPVNYQDVSLSSLTMEYYSQKESKEIFKAVAGLVKWYLDELDKNVESGKGIYFWSNTKGSGKTMLSAALANELINKYQKSVKFATSLDILDEIRATYDKHSEESESNLLRDLYNTEFLVIDDFGTERATDWVGEKFYQIVNNRYINNKVTFYTSNCNLQTLKYDDRITNRIMEKSYLVHFPEESVREYKARTENRSVE